MENLSKLEKELANVSSNFNSNNQPMKGSPVKKTEPEVCREEIKKLLEVTNG